LQGEGGGGAGLSFQGKNFFIGGRKEHLEEKVQGAGERKGIISYREKNSEILYPYQKIEKTEGCGKNAKARGRKRCREKGGRGGRFCDLCRGGLLRPRTKEKNKISWTNRK